MRSADFLSFLQLNTNSFLPKTQPLFRLNSSFLLNSRNFTRGISRIFSQNSRFRKIHLRSLPPNCWKKAAILNHFKIFKIPRYAQNWADMPRKCWNCLDAFIRDLSSSDSSLSRGRSITLACSLKRARGKEPPLFSWFSVAWKGLQNENKTLRLQVAYYKVPSTS